ncbi:hypothetical protein [Halobaculum lipolyticum]|uniref:Polysaccharide deacetylase n=1 Tax=Halobaculum lipolyticum TaxID=3032001 RepID=A0ABD5W628_9EURY|nr:hypothetical protein [Halobaculum sp. DT31]
MPDGFTTEAYVDLLDAAESAGYAFLTVAEYLRTAPDDRPARYLILRHDVDRKAGNAGRMARIEADRGVAATYYVRTSTFDPGFVRSLESLGHEVGYHYEDFVRANGDTTEAHERFARNLGMFRRYCDVETVCMHGNPLSPHDNRDMWAGDDAVAFEEYDLLGEAYLSMDFVEVTYFSDTGRTWRDGALKIKDHTVGDSEKAVSADTTADLAALLRTGAFDRGCLLVHPERWADSVPELLVERTKDHAINTVKRGLRLVRPTTTSTTT